MIPLRWFDRWVIKHAPSVPSPPPTAPENIDAGLTTLEKEVLYARLRDVEDTIRMYEAKALLRGRNRREPDGD